MSSTFSGKDENFEGNGPAPLIGSESAVADVTQAVTHPSALSGGNLHPPSARSVRVLIVDDEPMARMAIRHMIAYSLGKHEPVEASSLAEAVQCLERVHFDLVILDVLLPDGSGFELVPSLPPGTALVFFSAYEEYAAKAAEYAPLEYLPKPVRRLQFERVMEKFRQRPPAAFKVSPRPVCLEHRVALPAHDNVQAVPLHQISVVRARGNGSLVVQLDGNALAVQKTLRDWEEELPYPDFVRVHRGVIINIHQVDQILRLKNRQIQIIANGDRQPIITSIRLAPQFKKAMKAGAAIPAHAA
ncbi:MAG: LytTR family DNA-binding domain-containing protein [Verrucomicrobiota bacterium]